MIINILGLGLIFLIAWWFWLYKAKDVELADDELVILVENGVYKPSHIKLPAGKAVEIQFMRKDSSPCSESLLIPDLEISQSLPLNKLASIQLPAMAKGEYAFHCQMQMYRGNIIVE